MCAHRNTTELERSRFRQHGNADVTFDGRSMRAESTGPFNAEHIEASELTIRDLLAACPPNGPYVQLIRVHESALFSMDLEAALRRMIENLRADGILSAAVAAVDEEGCDGFGLMFPRYAAIYASYGIPVRDFTSYAAAEAWLESVLAAAGK
ncbi:hypothetical protein [Pseudoduganella sp. OTU4001]|uniref:hypothetical protein n=1 Tax=Pseudoduganella sp. OTU4001 TaxID=3043854 RepID=UPI00313DF557